ncbi:hypothetical protein ABT121_44265 [Streptomyces sp. NPDC001928]|uniref:hypothetical protein n=1 Tax=Streptomyces sp. NPDC001928 TaxID=3154404 RepID=UPI00332DC9AD
MTAPTARIRTAGAPPGRRRAALGVGALLAAVVLALLPLPDGADQARAATAGSSAVTKSGAKGRYDDFSNLKVTVHQTKGLRWQGVKVSWTGGKPAPTRGLFNFLQVMQCWGDDPQKGPDRTQCEFGNEARIPPGTGRQVSPTSDPEETDDFATDQFGTTFSPFRPVTGPTTTSGLDTTYFSAGDTNSLSWLPNDGRGEGEAVFEMKSALESEYLGCGARTTPAGEVRPCWLVVVPRGEHEPDGTSDVNRTTLTSALSKSHWDQRIVFRLDFEPVTDSCDPDKPERVIMGSELATDAVTSWQSALCRTGTHRFTYTQSGEELARETVLAPSDFAAGLAMTLDPVRPAEGAAQVVHAPVAVSGLAVGFVWMYEKESFNYTPLKELKLNQRLLAKALTQSYASTLVSSQEPVPDYLSGNPRYVGGDPEFLKLNPDFKGHDFNSPIGLVVTSENTDSARMMWKYILADPDAKKFLAGEKDPWGMKVNPEYLKDGVVSDSLDYFPKADLTPTTVACSGGAAGLTMKRTGQEVVPYATDMHESAVKVRRGDIGTAVECTANQSITKWATVERATPVNQRQFGVVDNVSAVRYQLSTAALPNADGDYVKPNDASLLKAVAQMPDADVSGVKRPEPAKMKDGAYPLAAVVYAAASVDQAKEARQDYAKVIRYAAGQGQTQGTASGQLPRGYAPLPTALRQQAQQAAGQLEKGAPDSGETPSTTTPGPDGGPSGAGGDTAGTGSAGAAGTGGLTAGGSTGTAGGATAPAAGPGASDASPASAAPTDTDPAKQNVAQSGGLTPSEVLGLIRWVLLGVLIAGGVAALAGPVMLRLSVRGAGDG